MPIIRVKIRKKENPYVIIDKRGLNDKTLSWKARGILAYLLSKPDDWKIMIGNLKNESTKDGIASVRAGMDELLKKQYAKKIIIRNKGRFSDIDYEIYEHPTEVRKSNTGEPPKCEKPKAEKPKAANHTKLINDKILINDITNYEALPPMHKIEKLYQESIQVVLPEYDIKKDYEYGKNRKIINRLLERHGFDKLRTMLERYFKNGMGEKNGYALTSLQNDWVWNQLLQNKKMGMQYETKDQMIKRKIKQSKQEAK